MYLNLKGTIDSVAVYTITGQKVSNISSNNDHSEINLSSLSSGVYLIKVFSNGGVENLKVVKQ